MKVAKHTWWHTTLMCSISLFIITAGCNNLNTTKELVKKEYNQTQDFMKGDDSYGTYEAQTPHTNRSYSLVPENKSPLKPGDKLYISEQAANEVTKNVDGIASTFVVLAHNDAYVAVVTDLTATGIFTKGTMDDDVDNAGESEGVYDIHSGSSYADPDKLVTDTNTYYTTTGKEPLSAKALQKIGDTVRQVHPEVLHVYISSNRTFVNGINQFMQAYWSGQQIQGYEEQFNRMIQQAFP